MMSSHCAEKLYNTWFLPCDAMQSAVILQ